MLVDPTSMTLGEALSQVAVERPDGPAMLSEHGELTWAELDAEVDRMAGLLTDIGVSHGDVVGFMISKRPEVVTGFLACARVGAIMAPINFKLHSDHVRDQLVTAGIRTIFVETAYDELLSSLLPELPDPRRIIYIGAPGRYGKSHTSQEVHAAGPWSTRIDAETPCYLNYTSGTTGRPKGAITTHRNILENAIATIEGLEFRETDTFLGMFSVFAHPHELFHRSLIVGGPFVILDTMSPRVIAKAVERWGVTWMMAVPSFYEMMLDYAQPRDGSTTLKASYDLSSLRVLESGGAYVGADTLSRMEALFGACFLPVWGCTEATGVALANGPEDRVPGATGRPVPGYEVAVVDAQSRPLPAGETGELLIRGPSVAHGYINNPDETAALFKNGWYHTCDLVKADEQGFIYFQGRRSEMLKIGGIRVYPLEIEKVIKDHPEVRDVVVVRAEERVRGEIARAVISTIAGSTLDVREIQAYCRDRMAVYKVPRLVEFWAEVPKLPNGKIDKRAVLNTPPDPARDER
jgi:long-chain acyl-CoA synthetase